MLFNFVHMSNILFYYGELSSFRIRLKKILARHLLSWGLDRQWKESVSRGLTGIDQQPELTRNFRFRKASHRTSILDLTVFPKTHDDT